MRWIEASARELARERFILDRDIPLVTARAKSHWQTLAGPAVEK
jgi:hypothetical protein